MPHAASTTEKSRAARFAALILAALLAGSCAVSREIDELAIVLAIGVDSDEANPGSYLVTVQIAQPSAMHSAQAQPQSGQQAYVNVSGYGRGISEALFNIRNGISRQLFTRNNQIVIISEEVASDSMTAVLDYFLRSLDGRLNEDLLIVKGASPEELLSVAPLLERTPGVQIDRNYLFMEDADTTLFNFVAAALSSTTNPTLPVAEILTSPDGTRQAKITCAAVFKDARIVCYIPLKNVYSAMCLLNKRKTGYLSMDFEDRYFSFSLNTSQSRLSVEPTPNGGYRLTVKVTQDYSLLDTDAPDIDYKFLERLEDAMNKQVEAEFKDLFDNCADLGVDVIGVGELIRRNYPVSSREYLKDWDRRLGEIEIEYDVDVRIFDVGIISRPAMPRKDKEND